MTIRFIRSLPWCLLVDATNPTRGGGVHVEGAERRPVIGAVNILRHQHLVLLLGQFEVTASMPQTQVLVEQEGQRPANRLRQGGGAATRFPVLLSA